MVAQVIGHGLQTAVKPLSKLHSDISRLQGRTIELSLAHSGDVSVDLFDLQGHRVANLHEGAFSAGTHALELGRMNAGVFVVRAKGAGVDELRKVIVE